MNRHTLVLYYTSCKLIAFGWSLTDLLLVISDLLTVTLQTIKNVTQKTSLQPCQPLPFSLSSDSAWFYVSTNTV